MDSRYVLAGCIVVIVLSMCYPRAEGFKADDKAANIYRWFTATTAPTYTKYKQEVPNSNIVEYEDALALAQRNALTIDNIKVII